MDHIITVYTENVHLAEEGPAVEIIDQTRLPNEEVMLAW